MSTILKDDDEELEQQGQEALLFVEETRSTFLRRTTATPATQSLLWPNDDDSISKESFQKALLARRTLEGSSMSDELKIILDDAVKKGVAAVENRQMDRAKQLLEFIIVPTTITSQNDVPHVDTVSSLGFDRSDEVRHFSEDLLSMSSLNEILDAPLTPEQKQAKFRVFWFGRKQQQQQKKKAKENQVEDTERFVTTVVCDDGTMLAREQEENSLHRIEEELRIALDDISTQKAVTSADGVPLHTTPPRHGKDSSSNASGEAMEQDLNESSAQNEVSFISIETTAVEDINEQQDERENPPRPRSQSPLKRLLQRRSTKTKAMAERNEPAAAATQPETTEDLKPNVESNNIAVSPSTAVGNAVMNDDDRYGVDSEASKEDEAPANDHLDSDAFLEVEDRYAVPANACSFCDSLWRQPELLEREPSDKVCLTDQIVEESPVVDKYTEMSAAQVDENTDSTRSNQCPESNSIKTKSKKKKKKKRFALFRRRKNTNSNTDISKAVAEPSVPTKPLKGILKEPTKSFPVDEAPSVEHSVPKDGGSTSTVTSHDDDVEPDPLVDRLKQRQRLLDHGPTQQQRLDP